MKDLDSYVGEAPKAVIVCQEQIAAGNHCRCKMNSIRSAETVTGADFRRPVHHLSCQRNHASQRALKEFIEFAYQEIVSLTNGLHQAFHPSKFAGEEHNMRGG